jgi:hypothetical protein
MRSSFSRNSLTRRASAAQSGVRFQQARDEDGDDEDAARLGQGSFLGDAGLAQGAQRAAEFAVVSRTTSCDASVQPESRLNPPLNSEPSAEF